MEKCHHPAQGLQLSEGLQRHLAEQLHKEDTWLLLMSQADRVGVQLQIPSIIPAKQNPTRFCVSEGHSTGLQLSLQPWNWHTAQGFLPTPAPDKPMS